METIAINNPFGAPVYYKETVKSTMDEARILTGGSNPARSGTVIAAGEQSAGRGRSGRHWQTNKGENLSFTIILRYPCIEEIPAALTLRAGLCAALAIEDFIIDFVSGVSDPPGMPLAGNVLVKWPNDVMLLDKKGRGRKAAGILTEAESGNVYIGIGVNVAQMSFPPELADKACSIGQILLEKNNNMPGQLLEKLSENRFTLLEKILFRLYEELGNTANIRSIEEAESDWRKRLEEKLYMKGKKVRFVPGQPEELSDGSVSAIEGILQGVGDGGEILILRDSGETVPYTTGELRFTHSQNSFPAPEPLPI